MNERLSKTIDACRTVREGVQDDFKTITLDERQQLAKLLFDHRKLSIGSAIRQIKNLSSRRKLKSPSSKQILRKYAEHLKETFPNEWNLIRNGKPFHVKRTKEKL
jgi:hypothetical protein